ncbi:MAG: PQQ-binding-like beta-propeller repeat protein [Gammaproteobacteria bacterium]|nr:PQQ-binding-like beta-propeller repeat protein [Gammaproteobacteria bacterium]
MALYLRKQQLPSAPLSCCFILLAATATCAAAGEVGGPNAHATVAIPAANHYSPLSQITAENVSTLRAAWQFETGPGGLQTTPLFMDGVLYVATPDQRVIALDAAAGTRKWEYVPLEVNLQPVRGLTIWQTGDERVLFTSHGTKLTALDPANGQPINRFGNGGSIDIRENLGASPESIGAWLTSPGVIYRDVIIIGFRTGESRPAAPGAVRAYDVRTGELRWRFDFIPAAGAPGSETWPTPALATAGGANNWAGMTLDAARGIVFVPTGSAVDDFYGGDRTGANLFANSLVALDAASGRYLWHFQTVHHDIWDRDLPTAPVLLSVLRDGERIDAVAQGTKQGLVFLFERATGAPLFPIEERAVPPSDVPGEMAWPTQPFPTAPAPAARQWLTADDLTVRTPAAAAAVRAQFESLISAGPYTPLSIGKQTIVFPGFDGGMEWGGAAADPDQGVLYVNTNDVPWTGGLQAYDPATASSFAEQIYMTNCASCHGPDRAGSPPAFPSLVGIFNRRSEHDVINSIARGQGRMPGFPQLPAPLVDMLVNYLASADSAQREPGTVVAAPTASVQPPQYQFTGYRKFVDPDGYPAVTPPWGTLNAIDMNTGDYLWKIPLGEYPALVAQGQPDTGSENYGGPILTAGGVLFIGATVYDRQLRAFDPNTGALLWQADLPYAGTATPLTYMAQGRQYVVIATSGQRDPAGPQGSAYVAFALTKQSAGRTLP